MAKEIAEIDFERIIAEETANGNGGNAYIFCFQLAQSMCAEKDKEIEKLKKDIAGYKVLNIKPRRVSLS